MNGERCVHTCMRAHTHTEYYAGIKKDEILLFATTTRMDPEGIC